VLGFKYCSGHAVAEGVGWRRQIQIRATTDKVGACWGRAYAAGPTLRSRRDSGSTLLVRAVPGAGRGGGWGLGRRAKAVFDATDKRGVDVVFENVAAATWKDSISSLNGDG
jgi:hypothetical protein